MNAKANAYIRFIRPHHWVKNTFVLAPIFFSAQLFDPEAVLHAGYAVAVFCLLSSAVYVFNDLCDIEADSAHVKKRHRPLPSGQVSVPEAWAVLLLLLLSCAGVYWLADPPLKFGLAVGIYVVINLAYSMGLKHLPLIELFIVSSGFILRLVAGAVVVDTYVSSWIIVCTGLLSLMLTVGKRRGDIAQSSDPQSRRRSLQFYNVDYLDQLNTVLAGAIIVSYLLFCTSDYATGRFGSYVLITSIFVILGIFRYLQLLKLENQGDSPTILVVKDQVMRYTILAWCVSFYLIIYELR